MRELIKQFVISAFNSGKDRIFVRESLFGKVPDLETSEALSYFDSLSFDRDRKRKISLKDIPKILLRSIKLFFLSLVFLTLKIKLYLKKIFLGQTEEINFKEIENSFGPVKFFRNLAKRFKDKPVQEKRKFIVIAVFLLLLISLLFYANFIFYRECENSVCFREMVSKCNRAKFVSTELVFLDNKIHGLTSRGCKVEVTSLENDIGLPSKKRMVCFLPYGLELLPQSKIEFCTGELREEIQSLMISELHKTIGQNIDELNPFFRKL